MVAWHVLRVSMLMHIFEVFKYANIQLTRQLWRMLSWLY
jgi:hypothetical protein